MDPRRALSMSSRDTVHNAKPRSWFETSFHSAIWDRHTDPGAEAEYKQKVNNIDLLICGAGGHDSLLVKHSGELNVELPESMVGDLAFIPLDGDGRPVEHERLAHVLESLSPQPTYPEVLRIARDRTKDVLVIISGDPTSKLKVAHAILVGGLATHCVLGVSLARRLIDASQAVSPD
jgi:hypothetical protein